VDRVLYGVNLHERFNNTAGGTQALGEAMFLELADLLHLCLPSPNNITGKNRLGKNNVERVQRIAKPSQKIPMTRDLDLKNTMKVISQTRIGHTATIQTVHTEHARKWSD